MIDHLGLIVRSVDASKTFYTAALAPLGYGLIVEQADYAAFGPAGKPLFWLYAAESEDYAPDPVHVAFAAADRPAVDAFHAASLAAGAQDNGAPGLRPDYHPDYYGAFVIDPDGNNIEAVCHDPG